MSRISQTLRELSLRKNSDSKTISTPEANKKPPSQREKDEILHVIYDLGNSFSELLEITKSIPTQENQGYERNSDLYWGNGYGFRRQEHTPIGSIKKIREKKNQLVKSLGNLSDICIELQDGKNISLEIRGIIRQISDEVARYLTQKQILNYKDRIINLIEAPIKEALR